MIRLIIECAFVEGALLRVLSTAEHRGFTILGVVAEKDADHYLIKLDVEGTRDADLLCHQLQRLYDVHRVSHQQAELSV